MTSSSAPLSKKLGLFAKSLIIALFALSLLMLLGRNHFVLGTALIIARWGFVGLALILLYRAYRRQAPGKFRIMAGMVVVLLTLEYGYCKVTQARLRSQDVNTELVIMTYNVFFRNGNPNAAIEKVKASNPDVLVVQELTPNWHKRLEESLRNTLPYHRVFPLTGTHGIGVYSKFPIGDYDLLRNANNLPFAQVFNLQVARKEIQFINVHLASPGVAVENRDDFLRLYDLNYKTRSRQLEEIATVANEQGFHSQILVGDLNTMPYEPLYRSLRWDWVDLFEDAGVGAGHTFPNTHKMKPLITLDYIFARGNMKAIDVRAIQGGSSDHLPVVARIKI